MAGCAVRSGGPPISTREVADCAVNRAEIKREREHETSPQGLPIRSHSRIGSDEASVKRSRNIGGFSVLERGPPEGR